MTSDDDDGYENEYDDDGITVLKIGGSSITNKANEETLDDDALDWFASLIRDAVHPRYLSIDRDHHDRDRGGGGGSGDDGQKDACGGASSGSASNEDGRWRKEEEEQRRGWGERRRRRRFVVIHGAGSFGHHSAKRYGLRCGKAAYLDDAERDDARGRTTESSSGDDEYRTSPTREEEEEEEESSRRYQMEGLCKTRRSVQKLNAVTVDRLIYAGVNAIGISPGMTYSGLRAHGATTRYGNTNVNANANDDGRSGMRDLCEAIKAAIKAGLVPVVHGDACLLHDGMHGGILGGDTLAEGLVAMWNTDDDDGIAITIAADAAPRDDRGTIMDRTGRIYRGRDDDAITRVIFITDVGGVYTSDPKIDEGAELIRLILVDGDTGELSISKCDDGNDIGATPGGGRSLVSDDNDMLVTGSCHEHDVTGGLKAKLGAAVTIVRAGVDVVISQCGTDSTEKFVRGDWNDIWDVDAGTLLTKK